MIRRSAWRPLLVTLALSAVAVAAYLALRLGVSTDDTAAPTLAESVPGIELLTLNGPPVRLTELADRPLIINFWATWCAPCLREIPLLKRYQVQHPEVRIVGIAIDNPEAVSAFAAEMQFNYPVLTGSAAMDTAAAIGVGYLALPLTVFTAPEGRILGVHYGELHAPDLEQFDGILADIAAGRVSVATARRQFSLEP